MKQEEILYYVKSATAFLETIGHSCEGFTDQYHAAEYLTSNQEQIAQSIANFGKGHARVTAGLLRLFGALSKTARYFNKLKETEPCKA